MRQTKYRAWDNEYEEMSYISVNGLMYHSNPLKSDRIMGLVDVGFADAAHKSVLYNLVEENASESVFELMLSTGLTDKNNKDIYRCDIVRLVDMLSGKEIIAVIDYDPHEVDYGAGLTHTVGLVVNGYFEHALSSYVAKFNTLEVIGNIYENPELLK